MSTVAAALPHPGAPAACYKVRACSSIAEFDPREWDSLLSPDDFHASHRFVRVCEDSRVENADYRHVAVHEGNELFATASFCRMPVALDLLSSGVVRATIQGMRRLRRDFLRVPVAFCGLPLSLGQSSLRVRSGAHVSVVTRLVSRELERWALDAGARLICFKEFTLREMQAVESLSGQGYLRMPSMPSCSLPVAWRTFDEYLSAMRAGYRRQTRASLLARERLGLTVRLVRDWETEAEDFFPLYEQVVDRAPFRLERLNLAFFRKLAATMDDSTSLLLVEREDALLAAAVLHESPSVLTFLFAGIDYARNIESHAYLTLVTEIVAEAIRRRVSRLEIGQTTYDLKQRLGAQLDERWLCIKCPNRAMHISLRAGSRGLFPTISTSPRRVFRDDGP